MLHRRLDTTQYSTCFTKVQLFSKNLLQLVQLLRFLKSPWLCAAFNLSELQLN